MDLREIGFGVCVYVCVCVRARVCRVNSPVSRQEPLAGSRERSDERSGFGARELVNCAAPTI
jgi:hypothetical protein